MFPYKRHMFFERIHAYATLYTTAKMKYSHLITCSACWVHLTHSSPVFKGAGSLEQCRKLCVWQLSVIGQQLWQVTIWNVFEWYCNCKHLSLCYFSFIGVSCFVVPHSGNLVHTGLRVTLTTDRTVQVCLSEDTFSFKISFSIGPNIHPLSVFSYFRPGKPCIW